MFYGRTLFFAVGRKIDRIFWRVCVARDCRAVKFYYQVVDILKQKQKRVIVFCCLQIFVHLCVLFRQKQQDDYLMLTIGTLKNLVLRVGFEVHSSLWR